MSVTAVIPTWNRRPLLMQVLEDLAAQQPQPPAVIVVDNGSSDGTAEAAAAAGVQVIRFEGNLGFAAAVNAGIRAATTRWVAILNNDVLLEPTWLTTLVASAEAHQAHFACGRVLAADDPTRIDATFDAVCRGGLPLRCGSGRQDGPFWQTGRPIAFAPMTAAIFRRDLFDRLGFLDEQFVSYYEDVDFGLRCAAAGVGGWYEPAAVARHLGSATLGAWTSDTTRLLARNQVLLAHKHFAALWPRQVLVAQMLWGLLAARKGQRTAWLAGRREGKRAVAGRAPAAVSDAARRGILQSEALIAEVQQNTSWERFWRVYFRLAGLPEVAE